MIVRTASLALLLALAPVAAQSPAPSPSAPRWPTTSAGFPIVGMDGLHAALKVAARAADRRIGEWPPAAPVMRGEEPRFVVARVAASGDVRLEGLLWSGAKTFKMADLLEDLQSGPLVRVRLRKITWAPVDGRTAQLFELDAALKP